MRCINTVQKNEEQFNHYTCKCQHSGALSAVSTSFLMSSARFLAALIHSESWASCKGTPPGLSTEDSVESPFITTERIPAHRCSSSLVGSAMVTFSMVLVKQIAFEINTWQNLQSRAGCKQFELQNNKLNREYIVVATVEWNGE